ncbi:hypothetical protein TWF730_007382 [Orbilia blumenaviensis]|uniref:Uncharacterized protein n=1 Tax=Orbilia blumenaviensis TaxID=1796055 RepID=A0AAV9V8B6_9PEZI
MADPLSSTSNGSRGFPDPGPPFPPPKIKPSDGAFETTNIPISGTRPVELGITLRSPTNMSIKGALSLTDEEYEEIRDSMDGAIQNEDFLRDLDVDPKNSTEEQRKHFHDLLSGHLSIDLVENKHLVNKLTVRYKAVSPWLLYKFALLRRKKYKNMLKSNGWKDDAANESHSTIDIGNPNVKEDKAAATAPAAGKGKKKKKKKAKVYKIKLFGDTESDMSSSILHAYLEADFNNKYGKGRRLSETSSETSDEEPQTGDETGGKGTQANEANGKTSNIAQLAKSMNIWLLYIPAICVAIGSIIVGALFYKYKDN